MHWKIGQLTPVTKPSEVKPDQYQVLLLAINTKSFPNNKSNWMGKFLEKYLFQDWPLSKSNFVFPIFIYGEEENQEFISEEVMKFSFVLNSHGVFVGEYALKVIFPIHLSQTTEVTTEFDRMEKINEDRCRLARSEEIGLFIINIIKLYECARILLNIIGFTRSLSLSLNLHEPYISNCIIFKRLAKLLVQEMIYEKELIINSAILSYSTVGPKPNQDNAPINCGVEIDQRIFSYFRESRWDSIIQNYLGYVFGLVNELLRDQHYVFGLEIVSPAIDIYTIYFQVTLHDHGLELLTSANTLTILVYRYKADVARYVKCLYDADNEIKAYSYDKGKIFKQANFAIHLQHLHANTVIG